MFIEDLEMVLLEYVDSLKDCVKQGHYPSPIDIAADLCNSEYEEGKHLSNVDHTMALASMAAIAMCWLAHREEACAE